MVKINRTAMLDKLLELFKTGKVAIARSPESGKYISQLLSLKRVQSFVKDELVWNWQKTDGSDHYHFGTMYLLTACLLRWTAGSWTAGAGVALVSSFRLKG
jgi:thiosulfate reductase cytochrome b subunit